MTPSIDRETISGFVAEVRSGAGSSFVGTATKYLRHAADGSLSGMGGFRWSRAPTADAVEAAEAVLRRGDDWRTWHAWWNSEDDDDSWSVYQAPNWLPGSVHLRLQTCPSRPLSGNGGFRAGKVGDLDAVCGWHVDVDVSERRPHDERPYCPTVSDACALLATWSPTWTLDAGGGVVAAWLLAEPCRDITAAGHLAQDLRQDVADACAERGWDFDTPSPLGGWCPIPGTWNAFRQRQVTVLERGPRWPLADLRRAVSPHERHQAYSYDALPDDWRPGLGSRRNNHDDPGSGSRWSDRPDIGSHWET